MNKVKYLIPIIAIVAVLLMSGYTYSWFVTGADAQVNTLEIMSNAAVSMTFDVDGENQSAPLYGDIAVPFNGQKGVDENSRWIASSSNDDRVYIASYPLSFKVVDVENLGQRMANLKIIFSHVSVSKYRGENRVIYERLDEASGILPDERFTWEIVWNDKILGPYGEVTDNFFAEDTDPTVNVQLPYRQTINCTFNIVYMAEKTYWAENYRTTPTTTEYEPCFYSHDNYKGCKLEFIARLEVME